MQRLVRYAVPALLSLLLLPTVPSALAGGQYTLSEHLGHRWENQLISFPFTFEPGECDEIRSLTANGHPTAFQMPASELERHPDGSLFRARVYVLTDLKLFSRIVFEAHPEATASPVAPIPALKVEERQGTVSLETGPVGVRLPLGEFTGDVPAPYQGFRLTSGRWIGASELHGDPGPNRLVAEVTERGPLFAEVRLRYTYPGDHRYRLRARVVAGASVAVFTEEFDTEPAAKYSRNLRYAPLRFPQKRHGYNDKFEQSHYVRATLGSFVDVDWLEAYPDQPKHAPVDAKDPWLATLHPWQSWHGGTPLLPLPSNSEYLGLLALHAGGWVRPYENLGIVKQSDGEIVLQWPINDGRREWAVHFGPVESWLPTGAESASEAGRRFPSPLRQALVKWGEISLDKVKDWQLTWRDDKRVDYPLTVYPVGDLKTARQRITTHPAFKEAVERNLRYWGDPNNRQDMRLMGDIGYISSNPDDIRALYEITRELMDYYVEQTLFGTGFHGYRRGHDYGMLQVAGGVFMRVHQFDVLMAGDVVTQEEKKALQAQVAFYAHLLTDDDYWPENGLGKGNYNMVVTRAGAIGLLGAILPGHPRAKGWQRVGIEMLEDVLESAVSANGVMSEGTHYSGVTLDSILPLMVLLKAGGGTDYFANERFKLGMRWYAQQCPPVDVRFGRAYMAPFAYSHPTNTSQSARWAVAAAMTADADPEFSSLMMDTWDREGEPMELQVGRTFLIGIIDPDLPSTSARRTSQAWAGWGAVLRAHSTTPRETFLSITSFGKEIYGGNRPGARGALHLYAKGIPLALHFGARAFHDGAEHSALLQNRVVFDQREETRFETAVRQWASLDAADLYGMETQVTQVQGNAYVLPGDPGDLELSKPWDPRGAPEQMESNVHPWSMVQTRRGAPEDVLPQTWQRTLLFLKADEPLGPNYFVLRDSVQGSLPTQWNLWVLAKDLSASDRKAAFTGQYDVDVDVFWTRPPSDVVTGAWGREDRKERQRLLQLRRGPGEDYLTVLYPRRTEARPPQFDSIVGGNGVRIQLPNGRIDRVFLASKRRLIVAGRDSLVGRAGVVQQRGGWVRLVLLDGERISSGNIQVSQKHFATGEHTEGTIASNALSVETGTTGAIVGQAVGAGRYVALRVPDTWKEFRQLVIDGEAANIDAKEGQYRFQLPAGENHFELRP